MKPLISLFFALFLCGLCGALQADVYRQVDDGGVSYSDKSSAGAERLQISEHTDRIRYTLSRVYDGDTIVLTNGERVRLLGINAPEITSHFRKGEPGGVAARDWLKLVLSVGDIYLEYDIEKRDRYKRLLAYVFTSEGDFINAMLVEKGLAIVSIVHPNQRYANTLAAAQATAEAASVGMWNMPAYQPKAVAQAVRRHTKGWQRYRGQVKHIKTTKRYYRLILANNFEVKIDRKHTSEEWGDMSQYQGKQIEVRGWLSRRKEKYLLKVQHPSSIIELPSK